MEYDFGKPKPNTYKILKHFNQDIWESGNVKCWLDIDILTSYYNTLWSNTNYGTQSWHCTAKMIMKNVKLREELETILIKLKNWKASGEDNTPTELYKYASEKFKTRLLKFWNEFYLSGSTPAEWNCVTVLPVYKKGDRKDPNIYRGITY